MTARETALSLGECMYCGSQLEEKEVTYLAPFCPKDGQVDYGKPLNPGVSGEGDSS